MEMDLATPQETQAAKVDALMEQASAALVKRDYFEAERLAAGALRKAQAIGDYERMARIVMPLQEARRQKRDQALETGRVTLVTGELPAGKELRAGCYLVAPPRVGVDGRALREAADAQRTPVVVLVREPTSRDGLWPIVAVGPVTVRTKVRPPATKIAQALKKVGKKPAARADAGASPEVPPVEWFVEAGEALGDAAIEGVATDVHPATRADGLLERLEAHPDHEKLHQRLEEACREAAREPARKRRPIDLALLEAEDAFDDEDEGDEEE
jgi:hypothetical protein